MREILVGIEQPKPAVIPMSLDAHGSTKPSASTSGRVANLTVADLAHVVVRGLETSSKPNLTCLLEASCFVLGTLPVSS